MQFVVNETVFPYQHTVSFDLQVGVYSVQLVSCAVIKQSNDDYVMFVLCVDS